MTRQTSVNINPAPGVVGARASMNPAFSVVAGPFSLTAGALGVSVGKFAWNVYATPGGPGVANNYSPTAPTVPDGFVSNEMQAYITTWLNDSTLVIPPGFNVTEYYRGDFWAKNVYAEAALGQKVFANLFSGDIIGAAAGSFVTKSFGSSASFVATIAANTNLMTVASVASGVLAVGQKVSGTNIPPNTYIESLGNGTGGTGTYYLSQYPTVTITAGALTSVTPTGIGGFVGSASFTTSVMTVTAVTSGALAAGQLVQSSGVAAGTYITSLGTGTGGTGTYNLSTTPGTITPTQATSTSSFIETPFSVLSPGNVGDVIKIGLKN